MTVGNGVDRSVETLELTLVAFCEVRHDEVCAAAADAQQAFHALPPGERDLTEINRLETS